MRSTNTIENWLTKYKPVKSDDIIGNKENIEYIRKFLNLFSQKKVDNKKIPNPNLLITGKNGIGKSLMVDLILQEYDFDKLSIDLSTIITAKKKKQKNATVNKKATIKVLTGSNRTVGTAYAAIRSNRKLTCGNFKNDLLKIGSVSLELDHHSLSIPQDVHEYTTIKNYIDSRAVLVIDDASTIFNSKEKDALKALIKMNNKLKQFPIIIISNHRHNKLINEIRKLVTSNVVKGKKTQKITNEIKVRHPDYNEIEKFVKMVCAKEKLNLIRCKSDDIYCEIIEYTQYDIRRLINCLEELKMMYVNDSPCGLTPKGTGFAEVTMEKFVKYQETSKMKDIDPNIYEATEILLNKYIGIEQTIALYSEEKATVPLMIHENYPTNIKTNYPDLSSLDQINMICHISKNISESDKIDGLIYSNQCWNLQPAHGFYACVMPSYHINSLPGKLSIRDSALYEYTRDYTKTSTKKINNKAIKKTRENYLFKKMMIGDFLHIVQVLKKLFINGEHDAIGNLLKPYKLTIKEVESIINIDRIAYPKFVLAGKSKTIMKGKL